MKPNRDLLETQHLLINLPTPTETMPSWKVRAKVFINNYQRRHRTRQQLSRLTAAQLGDVGISPQQAKLEANKPFWQE